jgi:hypothetical protein
MRTNIVGLGDDTAAPNFQSAFVFEGRGHKLNPCFEIRRSTTALKDQQIE